MAGSIVDDVLDRITQAFPPQRSYGPDDFTADPMPPPVAHFLTHLLQRRLDLEMRNMREATSTWVQADHPDVHEAARAFRAALRPHLHIPAGEWKRVLRRAIQRVTAYLIHPTQTLTQFAFGEEEDSRPAATLRERTRFFASYAYLREAVEGHIEQQSSIQRTAFEATLRRADEQHTADFTADEWMNLLEPLFSLMELSSLRGIPVSFLQTFFQAKRARTIVQRLQTTSLEHGTMAISRNDLRRMLLAVEGPSGDTAPAADDAAADDAAVDTAGHTPAATPNSERAPVSSSAPSQPEPPQEEASNGPTPLWKQFQNAGGLSAEAPPEAAAPADDVPDDAPLWQRFRPAGAPPSSMNASAATESADATPSSNGPSTGDVATLERAVLGDRGPSNRALFIHELFGGSEDDYRATLKRLRTAPNWTRASQIIAQYVFRAHQVNIYSEPAVLFTNAVEDRFRQGS